MDERITVAAVGDIFLGRGVQETIDRKGAGYLFDLVRPFLRGHDIVIGNLESPVSNIKVVSERKDRLVARPPSLDGLQEAGFNAFALANNHIMDLGVAGLQDTINELARRKIGMAGAGLNEVDAQQPLRWVGGKNVVLLSYYGLGKGGNVARKSQVGTHSGAFGENGGHNSGELAKILADIQAAREETDIVLVAVHWGLAGMDRPMRHQVEMAHQMIDRGAKVILGSGPHVLQPLERYNGGLIAYSLGNFVFDTRAGQPSMILHISFVNGAIEDVCIVPLLMSPEHRPQPVDADGDPELYAAVQSLVMQRLDRFASDAAVFSYMRLSDLTPMRILKKLVWRDRGVYPLSFYFRCLKELIRTRLLSLR